MGVFFQLYRSSFITHTDLIFCLQIMACSGKDPWLHLEHIVHYMKTNLYLSPVTPAEKSGIRKAAKDFVVEGKFFFFFFF